MWSLLKYRLSLYIIIHTVHDRVCIGHGLDAAEYPDCEEKYQSPVDIEVQSTVFESACAGLKLFNYDSAPALKLSNGGFSGMQRRWTLILS